MSTGRRKPGKHAPIDPERLAALLDGQVGERQRAELLESLAASPDVLAGFADALAVTRALEAEGVAPPDAAAGAGSTADVTGENARREEGVLPLRRRRSVVRIVAIAAGVAALALAPWLWSRASAPGPRHPVQLAALVHGEGLPSGWTGRPWPSTRDEADPLTAGSRAARLGARLVDLQLAARTRDPAVAAIAADVRALLRGIPASAPVQAIYREVERRAGEAGSLTPLLTRGSVAVARLAGKERVEAGAWAEAARLAAARRDARFFRARASRAALDRAAARDDLPPPARAAGARLRVMLQADGPPDWPGIERAATELLAALGSG
jgi:hypothetical protein